MPLLMRIAPRSAAPTRTSSGFIQPSIAHVRANVEETCSQPHFKTNLTKGAQRSRSRTDESFVVPGGAPRLSPSRAPAGRCVRLGHLCSHRLDQPRSGRPGCRSLSRCQPSFSPRRECEQGRDYLRQINSPLKISSEWTSVSFWPGARRDAGTSHRRSSPSSRDATCPA